MQITRNSLDTASGPGDWFTGTAAPNRLMTHIAMQEADESGIPVTWASTSATRSTVPPRPLTTEGR